MMLIGELARRAGVPPSTVRYYERIGLLPAPPREGGRRLYGEDTVRRLRLIGFGKRLGFTLRQMKELSRRLERSTRASTPHSDVLRGAVARRAAALRVEIDRAHLALSVLEGALECDCESLESCPVVPA